MGTCSSTSRAVLEKLVYTRSHDILQTSPMTEAQTAKWIHRDTTSLANLLIIFWENVAYCRVSGCRGRGCRGRGCRVSGCTGPFLLDHILWNEFYVLSANSQLTYIIGGRTTSSTINFKTYFSMPQLKCSSLHCI